MVTLVHGLGTNTNPEINTVWMAVSKDPSGMEGMCAMSTPMGMMPLVATCERVADKVKLAAENLAGQLQTEVLWIKISSAGREVLHRWNTRN